jgi:hypothetical protein
VTPFFTLSLILYASDERKKSTDKREVEEEEEEMSGIRRGRTYQVSSPGM